VQDRAAKVAGYLGERLFARWFVRRLAARCRQRSPQSSRK
jgi:hypothetical protein